MTDLQSDPGAHGGDAADAFDVVVPTLPGYGFSTLLRKPGVNFRRTSSVWIALMERLGYPRFAAHGADWRARITADLGHRYPERVTGVHLAMTLPLDLFSGGMPAPEDYEVVALGQPAAGRQHTDAGGQLPGATSNSHSRPQACAGDRRL